MKILLIGLGSVGQRHLRNILHLGYSDVVVVSRSGVLPVEFASLQCFATTEQALHAHSYHSAIICTPTAVHFLSLFALLHAQVPNIYVEKPVSHNLEKVDELVQLANNYSNRIIVGYDLHFDPGLQKVKALLAEDAIGKVVSVNAQVGQFLPDWRPLQDYRIGMSAKIETGGGVMLDLIHEFDYLLRLVGPANYVGGQYSKSGALEIETEDVCEVLIRFKNNVIGTIHLDYLQQKLVRNCLITGYDGSIFWDLAAQKVSWIDQQKQEVIFEYKEHNRNDRFISIMKAFLSGEKDTRLTPLAKGIESLRLVMAAKNSSENNRFIQMDTFKIPQLVS